jgi:Ca2+-binding RTX toxin-like protein
LGEDTQIDGGDGSDTLILPNEPVNSALSKIFFLNGASGFYNFENLASGGGNDIVFGDANDNWIDGGLGNDLIRSGDGDDYLKGSEGINLAYGHTGHNVIDGSGTVAPGSMTLAAYSWAEAMTIDLRLASGNARLTNPQNSLISFTDDFVGIAGVYSGGGNDTISGDEANNVFYGNGGDDLITGGGGNDQIKGGSGNDTLSGGDGNDILSGGSGFDVLQGGQGVDLFIFGPSGTGEAGSPFIAETDTILGFESGIGEKIDLSAFGTLSANAIAISNSVGRSTITISLAHESQTIVIDNPSAAITMNDLTLIGGGSAQTGAFNIQQYFSI